MTYELVVSDQLIEKVRAYREKMILGEIRPGYLLQELMEDVSLMSISEEQLLRFLLASKVPMIFAETAVRGDGSDWNLDELSILGDVGVASQVTVYDNGLHYEPIVHHSPFQATLMFIPGALLRSSGDVPADWFEVTREDSIDSSAYRSLYERRLLPLLLHANNVCAERRTQAFVTVPGLGCGQFSGPFYGRMGRYLKNALSEILEQHHKDLKNIRAVYYDPYSECANERTQFGGLSYMVRPLKQGNYPKAQLCKPVQYQESGDDFSQCELFSIVAWDHVSWPGNDFYAGARSTDDGVKAAATNVMHCITGVLGSYSEKANRYSPPSEFECWLDVVRHKKLVFGRDEVIRIY